MNPRASERLFLGLWAGAAALAVFFVFEASWQGLAAGLGSASEAGGVPAPVFAFVAGVLCVVLRRHLLPGEAPHATEDLKSALSDAGRALVPRRLVARLGVTALGLGSGASVGREDPALAAGLHVGASIADARFGLGSAWRGKLGHAAACAVVGHSFGTPWAGLAFGVEVAGWGDPWMLLGAAGAGFLVDGIRDPSSVLIPLSVGPTLHVVGLVATAIVAGLYAYAWKSLHARFSGPEAILGRARPLLAGLVGATTVALGARVPGVSGSGHRAVEEALRVLPEPGAAALALWKPLVTMASFAVGWFGGAYAPLLAGAAGLGIAAAHGGLGDPAVSWAVAAGLAGFARAPVTGCIVAAVLRGGLGIDLVVAAALGAAASVGAAAVFRRGGRGKMPPSPHP